MRVLSSRWLTSLVLSLHRSVSVVCVCRFGFPLIFIVASSPRMAWTSASWRWCPSQLMWTSSTPASPVSRPILSQPTATTRSSFSRFSRQGRQGVSVSRSSFAEIAHLLSPFHRSRHPCNCLAFSPFNSFYLSSLPCRMPSSLYPPLPAFLSSLPLSIFFFVAIS